MTKKKTLAEMNEASYEENIKWLRTFMHLLDLVEKQDPTPEEIFEILSMTDDERRIIEQYKKHARDAKLDVQERARILNGG